MWIWCLRSDWANTHTDTEKENKCIYVSLTRSLMGSLRTIKADKREKNTSIAWIFYTETKPKMRFFACWKRLEHFVYSFVDKDGKNCRKTKRCGRANNARIWIWYCGSDFDTCTHLTRKNVGKGEGAKKTIIISIKRVVRVCAVH